MAVYVDNARMPYRRMKMCHMLADTEDELHAMADRIGVARRHYQGDHYDICLESRSRAVRFGAIETTTRQLVAIRRINRWKTEEPDYTKPPCQECGAMTAEESEAKCNCGGDKDHCHGVDLWG